MHHFFHRLLSKVSAFTLISKFESSTKMSQFGKKKSTLEFFKEVGKSMKQKHTFM